MNKKRWKEEENVADRIEEKIKRQAIMCVHANIVVMEKQ
jgi:hypothetical protein